MGQEMEFITEGNQKWKGAIPNFINKPNRMTGSSWGIDDPNRSILDPSA
jgi:hypothetical protein